MIYVAAMKVNCVCEWSEIHSADSVAKCFLIKRNQTERNEEGPTWICPIETHVWTNDYTPDQLDAGKSVQYGIEFVIVGHLDYANLSRPVHLHSHFHL